MNKISCNTWKTYSLSELGFLTYHGTRIKKTDRLNGDIIFLTAGKENLGVVGTIGNDIQIWHKPITIDMFGNCFYHDYDCAGDDNIYAFVNDNISDLSKIYISTVINKTTTELYSYTEQFRQSDANTIKVNLPAKSNGQPDWDYIDTFMRSIEIKVKDKLSKLYNIVGSTPPHLIQTVEWKEFRVGDIFTQERGKESAPNQNQEGYTPLIKEVNTKNGYDRNVMAKAIFKGNCITVSVNYASVVFYQPDDFCASVNILILRNRNLNKYSGLFIATALSRTHEKYDYTYKISKDRLNEELVYLPVKDDAPDWDYMTEYMKAIEELVDEKTRLLA